MALPKPNLDDRRFQDIVDEAKRMIPRYCPEWTDHNVSDPGVTLIELFAWMTETLIYRLNRVPEKSFITFLELMGVYLQPPAAASAELTFWLSAPAIEPVLIPNGTEVATAQTAAELSVIFRNDADLTIYPPELIVCLTSPDERTFTDETPTLAPDEDLFNAFSTTPQVGNAFYLGFDQNISSHILSLMIDCQIEGIGVNPKNPPLAWEALRETGWVDVEVERDETGGLNRRGRVNLYLIQRMTRSEIAGKNYYWVRCRYVTPETNQPTYSSTPQIRAIVAESLGGMVSATNCTTINGEILGRSDGRPSQSFRLENPPILPRAQGETVEILEDDTRWEPWTEVQHFGDSGPQNQHFILDSATGEITFGPAIREPSGHERQYGAIPPRGNLMRMSRYRSGGGIIGNVGANTIRRMKSAVPYVDQVTNRRPAEGGLDAENLEHAQIRAPQTLRTRFRAVTADDYETLARESSTRVARAHCLQAQTPDTPGAPPPGVVRVLLIPRINQPEGRLAPEQLQLPTDMVQEVRSLLDERRLLTTRITIEPPEYRWVSVTVNIKALPTANVEVVRRDVTERLYRFLNPLVGGADGEGWPFGHDLFVGEIYTILQGTPGIRYIEQVSLALEGSQEPLARVSVPINGLIASAEHKISVE